MSSKEGAMCILVSLWNFDSNIVYKMIFAEGPPPRPPTHIQNYGPQFQNANNVLTQPFFQYSQCTGKKKALCVCFFKFWTTICPYHQSSFRLESIILAKTPS